MAAHRALIALGFARYHAKTAVNRIFRALFDAATFLELHRLPELFCGFPRFAGRGPTLYPVACAPQAWAAGTFFAAFTPYAPADFFEVFRSQAFLRSRHPGTWRFFETQEIWFELDHARRSCQQGGVLRHQR